MSHNTRQFLAFIGFITGWSLIAAIAVALRLNPIAVFTVWLVGFVYGTGLIVGGPLDAKLMLKRWIQMLAGVAVIGGLIALFLS